MSFAEESRKTDEHKAYTLARELFNVEDEPPGFIVYEVANADEIPLLKGMHEGIEGYLNDLVEAKNLSLDGAAKILTGIDMAKILIYAYIISEVPDVPPPPTDN